MKTHEHAAQLATIAEKAAAAFGYLAIVAKTPEDREEFKRREIDARAALAAWKAHNKPAPAPQCIQTACRYCGQDIENLAPFKRGEWRDRGNNSTCPDSKHGRKHAPWKP